MIALITPAADIVDAVVRNHPAINEILLSILIVFVLG
jgi:hypothetical protein